MKKTVQIVTIPLNKEGWGNNALLKRQPPQIDQYIIADKGSNPVTESIWQAQQLLVLSDDEIQEGDICHDYCDAGQPPYKHLIGKCLSVDKTNGWIEFKDYKTGLGWCKKIIASYPHIEGTLPISKETVQAWIDDGTPLEVTLKEALRGSMCLDPQGNLLLEFGEKEPDNYCPSCTEGCEYCITEPRREQVVINKTRNVGTSFDHLKSSIPTDAHSLEVFAIKPDETGKLFAYIGFKIANGNFEFIAVPYTEPKPSIPTDEEIREKARNLKNEEVENRKNCSSENLINDPLVTYEIGIINGYKQALKDLGYE